MAATSPSAIDTAKDLVGVMRRDAKTDWTIRADVEAKLRSQIKSLLTRHGYPPFATHDGRPTAMWVYIGVFVVVSLTNAFVVYRLVQRSR